jgi:hypothetical protein
MLCCKSVHFRVPAPWRCRGAHRRPAPENLQNPATTADVTCLPSYGRSTSAVTVTLSPIRDTLIEGFSHFVTSMTAPIASGWSGCRVGLAPTGKRRLCTAHANNGREGQRRSQSGLHSHVNRLWVCIDYNIARCTFRCIAKLLARRAIPR